MRVILLLLTLNLFLSVSAQKKVTFKKGSNICFIGNSITNAGEFHHNVFLYYATRFPKDEIRIYNCGISGDNVAGVLRRLDWDVLSHQPEYAVIMIGMNDVNRGLYPPASTSNADTLKLQESTIKTYTERLDSLVRRLLLNKVKVMLQKPSIYDQTAKTDKPNNFGVNDALKKCADFMQSLADKYDLPIVDYWTIMTDINKQVQAKDSAATIVGSDRVHPGSTGHLVMAYQFLKTNQLPQYVAQIEIKKDVKATLKASHNCTISNFSKAADQLQFTVKENALPFPTSEGQAEGLRLVPFTKDLNQEMFKVNDLKDGVYKFYIDSTFIGEFTSKQLAEGINLADIRKTPQFVQAMAVKESFNSYWKTESDLRTITHVEFKYLNSYEKKNDTAAVRSYLYDMLEKKFANGAYYKKQFDRYFQVKDHEAELHTQLESFYKQSYEMAQPKEHVFKILFKNN